MPTSAPNPFARPLGPVAAAGWSSAFLVVFAAALTTLSSIHPGSEFDEVSAALLDAAAALAIIFGIARVHAPDAPIADLVGARPIGFLPALAATLMGAAAVVPLGALEAFIARRNPIPEKLATELAQAYSALGHNERIAGALASVVVFPIADELLFRGAIASGIARDRGRWVALILTSLTFAIAYAALRDFHELPVYLAAGLMFGVARFGTGSVLPAIGAHLAWRGAELAIDARRAGTIDPIVTSTIDYPRYSPAVLAAGTAATLLFAFVLLRFGPRSEHDERAPAAGPPAAAAKGSGDAGGDDEDGS